MQLGEEKMKEKSENKLLIVLIISYKMVYIHIVVRHTLMRLMSAWGYY